MKVITRESEEEEAALALRRAPRAAPKPPEATGNIPFTI